ncbi:glycosyltransferase [Corynebacterium aquatimens]|uniref:glycosyltransferase n=1 Tax=Corynebacterium TaxID=1716 RepID=UPI001F1D9AB8|nr:MULTISPECIES: glycosyltransferase [Corynebacterium]QYH19339.1 glycosyltransferase [Corynebacterium aquatimens]UIZ91761.1 glycosyltransferase [Corynebacterium sp. CNCTC7651]
MNFNRRAVRVLSIPAEHPYTQAIRPAGVAYLPDPDIDGNWWPHPAFTAKYWRELDPAQRPDILHVHFGFEHFTTAEISAMVAELPVPLVVTVHDIDNPHLEDQRDHHARLKVLVDAAAATLTLTDCAAAALREDFGVGEVNVVKHPRIAAVPAVEKRGERAAVFVKSLRGNVVADAQFYRDIAAEVPLDVYVHDVPATEDLREGLDGVENLALHVHEPFGDAELHAAVARAGACVLPYTRGTHSGWLEMCRDHGTPVAVPDIGCYAGQADTPEAVAVYPACDGRAAGRAAKDLVARGGVAYHGDREAQLREVQAVHARVYSEVLGSAR